MQHVFETPSPTDLYVEVGVGDVHIRCDDVARTTIDVDGDDAEDVVVEQRGEQIAIIAPPRRGGLFLGFGTSSQRLRVRVTMPHGSALATKLGSADLDVAGRLGPSHLKTGSGDVRLEQVDADAAVEAGSGDVEIGTVTGELRVKCGSGDVQIAQVGGAVLVSTGSGDVEIGTSDGPVQAKSGSGDLHVGQAHHDVVLSTASGNLSVGRMDRGALRAHNVSGDIRVGIPAGVPVWTDINCVTGSVRSDLDGAGEPADGHDFVEVRAKTVSGDVALIQR